MGTTPVLSHPLRLLVLVLAALLIGIALAASSIRPASAAVGTCTIMPGTYVVTEGQQINIVLNRSGGNETAHVRYYTEYLGVPSGRLSPAGSEEFTGSSNSETVTLTAVDNGTPGDSIVVDFIIDENVGGGQTPCSVPGDQDSVSITINDDDGPQKSIITSVSPSSDNTSGGADVTILGANFLGATCPDDVTFGGTAALSCSIASDNRIQAVAPNHAAGIVDVLVDNRDGGQNVPSAASKFEYTSGPAIHSLNPASRPAGQTSEVVIHGNGFTGASAVSFGGTPAVAFNIDDDDQITATAPALTVGTVRVSVTSPSGTSPNTPADDFTYTGNIPLVTSVTPNSGPVAGGTQVTITGQFLGTVTSIKFGSFTASVFHVDSSTTLTATVPSGTVPGTVDVTVITPAGTSPTAGTGNDFTYTLAPTITGLNPDTGPTGGNNNVIISGTNLLGVTTVSFGGTNALSFVINGATQITAVAPPHALGTVNVSVTNASGTSPNVAADDYEYLGGPNITGVSPTGGPTAGGTVVTITGSGFTGVTAVSFGAIAATSFTFVSDTSITATSPAQALGTVHIRVSAPGGTSPEVNADRFTYGVPSVSALTPNSGPKTGGGFITITGSNFLGATIVLFGTNESPAIQVSSGTSIVAQVPAGTGVVHVRVQSPAGLSTTTDDDEYTYNALPTISSLSPSQGPVAGGTQVVITGTDLTGATSVAFGGNAATSFQVDSSTKITAVAPAGVPGAVTVRVVTPQGTSPTGSGTTYTYKSSTATVTYSLSFRWNLVTWAGPTGIDVIVALQSLDGNNETTSIYGDVTAVYFYQNPGWLRFFPAGVNIPGTNTLSVLVFGNAYWIALDEARSWVIPAGP
ncbi:MAG: IPT/TIG domain-containing protein [Dehalococcoidia bacterium]|nr:IPT/TIG domain-containing protein [Dehalococcoidia bacterium]